MKDEEFDTFLGDALAPPRRGPDRRFVAVVQARVALEDQLAVQRRLALSTLAKQGLALLAVAAGLVWLARAGPVRNFLANESGFGLLVLVAAFVFLLVLLSPGAAAPSLPRHLQGARFRPG